MIAGCRNANQFARALLYRTLEFCTARYIRVWHFEWVDDLVQRTEGTRKAVLNDLFAAGVALATLIRALGLTIADNSVCI